MLAIHDVVSTSQGQAKVEFAVLQFKAQCLIEAYRRLVVLPDMQIQSGQVQFIVSVGQDMLEELTRQAMRAKIGMHDHSFDIANRVGRRG
jgi:hypothetical protein